MHGHVRAPPQLNPSLIAVILQAETGQEENKTYGNLIPLVQGCVNGHQALIDCLDGSF